MTIEWRQGIGYENGYPVAFIYPNKNWPSMRRLIIKVMGGKPKDNYFIHNTIQSEQGNVFSWVVLKIAEVTRRIIKDQPNKDAAQAAIRAYARMKGDYWWEDG